MTTRPPDPDTPTDHNKNSAITDHQTDPTPTYPAKLWPSHKTQPSTHHPTTITPRNPHASPTHHPPTNITINHTSIRSITSQSRNCLPPNYKITKNMPTTAPHLLNKETHTAIMDLLTNHPNPGPHLTERWTPGTLLQAIIHDSRVVDDGLEEGAGGPAVG